MSERSELPSRDTEKSELGGAGDIDKVEGNDAEKSPRGVRIVGPARKQSRSAPAARLTAKTAATTVDLRAPELYLNRELTWLSFNQRVLNEAQDKRNPLLERVKFLAIASSNLDEFFMKRLGGLKQQVATNVHQRSVDGRTPQEQITECTDVVREMQISLSARSIGTSSSLWPPRASRSPATTN